jgi:effector-binding domain-containing protein
MQYDIRLETITHPKPTAVVRRRASKRDLPRIIPEGCGIVWKLVRANQIPGAGRHVALYLDCEVNLEVGVELESPCESHGELICSSLPVGLVATTTHFGPYQQLGQAHQAILDFCTNHGHKLAGPDWEIYGHWEDAWNTNPSLIRTDLFYLLAS